MRYPPVVMISSSRRLDQKLTLLKMLCRTDTCLAICTSGTMSRHGCDQQEIQQLEINLGF